MTTTLHPHSALSLRQKVYQIIEVGRGDNGASRLFDVVILTLILLNVAAVVLETVPSYAAAYGPQFEAFNIVSVAVFWVEYLLRLWTAVEVPFLRRYSPSQARMKLATTPALIIDLLAILPFYLQAIFGLDLRILRVLRLLRFPSCRATRQPCIRSCASSPTNAARSWAHRSFSSPLCSLHRPASI